MGKNPKRGPRSKTPNRFEQAEWTLLLCKCLKFFCEIVLKP
jgi:hypothetical protein